MVELFLFLLLVAYVMYFFFLRRSKRNKIDPGVRQKYREALEGEGEGGGEGSEAEAKYWTHSQRVADEEADLKCIVSTVDGERYCVRDRENIQASVDLLAKVTKAMQLFIEDLKQKYPRDPDVDRLYRNYDPRAVSEILPNSYYEAVTTNKGEEVEFCLLKQKSNNENLIDEHTLFFVALHEITHIMCKEEDHPPLFWKQFGFLLTEAKELGYHEPRDYSKHPVEYCDRKINDSPYFNWRQFQSTYGDGDGGEVDTFRPQQ